MSTVEISSHSLLPQFSEFLTHHTGLYFPKERWNDLLNGIKGIATQYGLQDAEDCMRWLLSTPPDRNRIETIAHYLTIGETYFFRDPIVIEALQSQIQMTLIPSRRNSERTIRVWSAGCATGEEPYSIAIMLQRIIPDFRQWHITILGTDINSSFLTKAKTGIYSEWSFRNAPNWLKSDYFHHCGNGHYKIISSVQEMVTFAYQNLMDDNYPSIMSNANTMDIIFCRNVLMYFTKAIAEQVLNRHCLLLKNGGWLITSPTEAIQSMPEVMEMVSFPGAILYRKKNLGTLPDPTIRQTAQAASYSRSTEIYSPHKQDKENKTPPLFNQPTRSAEAATKTVKPFSGRQRKTHTISPLPINRFNHGDLAKTKQWCVQTINTDRLNPTLHYLLAIVLLEQGQTEESIQELKRTLYLDSNYILAHFTLGNLYKKLETHKQANKHFDNALLLLDAYPPDKVLPEADELTAGRLAEIIHTLRNQDKSL